MLIVLGVYWLETVMDACTAVVSAQVELSKSHDSSGRNLYVLLYVPTIDYGVPMVPDSAGEVLFIVYSSDSKRPVVNDPTGHYILLHFYRKSGIVKVINNQYTSKKNIKRYTEYARELVFTWGWGNGACANFDGDRLTRNNQFRISVEKANSSNNASCWAIACFGQMEKFFGQSFVGSFPGQQVRVSVLHMFLEKLSLLVEKKAVSSAIGKNGDLSWKSTDWGLGMDLALGL